MVKLNKLNDKELRILFNEHKTYLETQGKLGKKMALEDIDFTGNDLCDAYFEDAYIAGCHFYKNNFINVNFDGSQIYDTKFMEVNFDRVSFVKSIIEYCLIDKANIKSSKIFRVDTQNTVITNSIMEDCVLYECFNYIELKNITFKNIDFSNIRFWQTAIEGLIFENVTCFNEENVIKSLNMGALNDLKVITGEKAIDFFYQNTTIK